MQGTKSFLAEPYGLRSAKSLPHKNKFISELIKIYEIYILTLQQFDEAVEDGAKLIFAKSI
jgi:5'(3')-deoxyribonucleotidase